MTRDVINALRDAEAWTAKYCADNNHQDEPGHPVLGARRALIRIADVRKRFVAQVSA